MNRQKLFQIAIVLYVAILAGLIGVYFYITTMEVEYAAYIQSSEEMVAGEPNALRAILIHAPTGRRVRSADIELYLSECRDKSVET